MRLPYTDNPPNFTSEEDKATLEAVKARRGPRGLIALDLALLHAPPIAGGWNALLGAVRTKNSLNASIREIAISRVAVLNKAWFEWNAHAPILKDAGEVNDEGINYVKTAPPTQNQPLGSGPLDEKHAAVMAYADAMTKDVEVSDAVFSKIKSLFSEREVIELTATIAAYNCVSRFLVALDVGEANSTGPN
ncbi:hypothetical protein NA57DRAFT_63130 [Rhizodiscina lignyota]|uniref:Carboxymuconolactone decarboxylase-like domain-containing protein n=1 Tax=Rhizodiscina lignyota TaxID=1504668 RepID=A0A9P4IRH9_9PEZI|nr:hypothetical protein NA57DRAFT_63130 [Rhizodiscina lignyota]